MRTIEKSLRSVEDIKTDIIQNVGKDIVVRESNRQGKQIKEYLGTIIDTYESLFLMNVRVNSSRFNKSFSYVELLTREFSYEFPEKVQEL